MFLNPYTYITTNRYGMLLLLSIIRVFEYTPQLHSIRTKVFDLINSGESYLLIGFFLIISSVFLFVIQLKMFSMFFSTVRWGKVQEYGLTTHGTTTTVDLNRTFLYPLWVAQVVFFLFLFRHGGTGCALVIEMDLRYVPFLATNSCMCFFLDDIAAGFLATTAFIGSVVNTLIPYYMAREYSARRFTILLNSFLFSMVFLIISSNFLTFLFFWELIGLFSYFLINYWVQKCSTFKSAAKALFYNLFSDAMLAFGMVKYFNLFGTFQFPSHNSPSIIIFEGDSSSITTLLLPLFVAASCKSVQFLYHFWLPDSMDAPVPASALIHSATLVAAGILLVLRIKPIVLVDSTTPTIFSYLSLITILVGGLAAVSHTDSKKILAYSTISNCGYMMFLAINAPESATLVFFIAHGLLKALSFICIGLLIIILKHKQDFKYGGDLANLYQMLFFVTTLSVCTLGSAPTTVLGIIKHQLFYTGSPCLTNIFITGLVFCIGGVTSFVYSIRLVTIIFISSRNRWSADRNNTNINPVNYSWRHFISGFVNRGFSTNIILIKVTAALVQTFIIILLLFFTYLRGLDIALVDSDFGVFILRSVERYGFYDYTTYSLPINLGVGRLVGLLQLGIMLSMTAPMWFGKKIKTTAPLYGHVWCLLAIITLLP